MDIDELEELKCNICFNNFDEKSVHPRVLNCGHSFCKCCLEKIIAPQSKCPKCKNIISYTHIDNVPVNYELQSLTSRLKKKNCKKSCATQNQERDLKNNPTTLPSVGICEEHNIEKQFRCMDGKEWACSTCIVLHHKDCRTLNVAEAFLEMKAQYPKDISELIFKNVDEAINRSNVIRHLEKKNLTLKLEMNDAKMVLKHKIKMFKHHLKFIEEMKLIKREGKETIKELKKLLHNNEVSSFSIENIPNITDMRVIDTMFTKAHDLAKEKSKIPRKISVPYDLMIERCRENSVYVSRCHKAHNRTEQFGQLVIKQGRFWIRSFKDHHREGEKILLISLRSLLASVYAIQLPRRTFLQIKNEDSDLLEDVVISTDAYNPWALTFILLCSGIKGTSFEGAKFDDSNKFLSTSNVELPAANGNKNGIYKATVKKSCVYGFFDGNTGTLGGFMIALEDDPAMTLDTKCGFVESGFKILQKIKQQPIKFTIVHCGLCL